MFKLSECISRINQILNYPAITYTDISHFFDQAISELNSTFKIGMPLVSQMIENHRIDVQTLPNLTLLSSVPRGDFSDIPSGTLSDFTNTSKVYFNVDDSKIYKFDVYREEWVGYDKMYGLYLSDSGERTVYETIVFAASNCALWSTLDDTRTNDIDLNIYLPTDWVILFLIPYVCFKSNVRDGGNGALYNEEFVQGFQQLQTSYDVPNFVNLSEVAHLPAYTKDVKEHITALNVRIPTRAIYDSMKVGNSIMPTYGGFNSRGGWGL